MNISKKLIFWQAVVIAQRAERARRRQLERDIAAYTSPADRMELDAILSRHTEEQSQEVQAILNRQAMSSSF